MADDEMFEQGLEIGWKAGQLLELGLEHLQFDDHVTEQLAASAVGKRPVIGQFVNLPDIVQECTRQEQIAVDLRIIPAKQIAGTKQRNYVIEQAADVGMV